MSKGRFPTKEAEILELARKMISGFKKNKELYPTPPVPVEELEKQVEDCENAQNDIDQTRGIMKQQIGVKDNKFDSLEHSMKKQIRYAENTSDFNDGDLERIGWHGRHKPEPLQPPGQVLKLIAKVDAETGTIYMKWEDAKDGGKADYYKINIFRQADSSWGVYDTISYKEAVIKGLPEGETVRFRIIAVNKAGEGMPSNTVTVTV